MKKSFIALATTMAIHPVLGIAQAPVNLGEINPSTAVGSNPGFFTSLPNDRVVFFANEDSDGTFDVFGTDGTPQGTQKLKETAVVPAENFLAFSFGRLGDRVLFPVSGVNGLEIWSTDGTLQNTVRLAETNIAAGENAPAGPNQISANPADFRFFTLFNFTNEAGGLVTQELLFTAGTNATGVELWRTGGTPQTTNLVADMNPGTAGSFPYFLGAFGAGFSTDPAVYIAATTATQGREMFLSDGTSQGTVFLGDLEPGSVGVFDLPENDQEAFEIAALNAGTFFLENNTPQPDVFPLFTTANGYELWASQGTAQTTVLLGNINPGDGSSIVSESGDFAFEFDYVTNFTNLRSVLVFAATDGANGVELWRTNGTPSGTFLLKDFVTAPGVSGFGDQLLSLNQVNNNAVFLVNAPVSGLELWVTNGSQGGTNLLKDIIPGTGTPFQPNFFGLAPISISNPTTFIPSRLLFLATTPAEGTELWTTDGTTANTVILKDLSPGAASSFPVDTILASQPVLEFFNANKIALLADSTANGIELFITNGTPNNLDLLAEINTSGDAFPDLESLESVPFVSDSVTPVSQYLFAARQSTTGRELWITDGTTQNTKLVKDLNPGAADGLVEGEGYLVGLRNATAFDDNQFWFIGKTATQGAEPWFTDGTTNGTQQLLDVNPGAADSLPVYGQILGDENGSPTSRFRQNNKFLFTAITAEEGRELWVSEGTAQSTQFAGAINPGTDPAFGGLDNNLIFNEAGEEVVFPASNAFFVFGEFEFPQNTEPWAYTLGSGPTCSYTIVALGDPGSVPPGEVLFIPVDGGSTITFQITTQANCPWNVQGLTDWINPSATSGTGSGQVSISFEPNTLPQQRSATITIAGTSFLYTQFAGDPQTEGDFFLFY